MDQRNARPPLLSLWSRPDWTTKHKVIAQENGHVCSQHEVLDTTDHTRNDEISKASMTIKQRPISTIVIYLTKQEIFKDGII